ncbi:YceD family protein [Porcipelethomonas sp.]|uniref:YceD family protein n=1 Tax=Porcipelethomonas sp. TaxID=2981675 RepID=UPI003EF4C1F9
MTADLRQVFNIVGERREFAFEIPAAELKQPCGYDFAEAVVVAGCFYNRADVVHMNYSVKFTLNIVCDRCLKELKRDFFYEFEHVIVSALSSDSDESEFIVAENYRVDISEIALSDLLLELPTKLLCSDDCKGLCPVCGCDLNESECNCQKY